MSDSLATVAPVAAVAEDPPRAAVRGRAAPADSPGGSGLPETRAAARDTLTTEGRFQIRIHADTLRIITEVVDTVTGDVLMYLPPGYRPDAKPDPDGQR